MLHKAYRNLGNFRFADEGLAWGFINNPSQTEQHMADLDNDGDMDLIINNENGPAFIYKNNAMRPQ